MRLWLALALACAPAIAMAIQASPVDTRKYFADARLAEFAKDIQAGNLAKVQEGLRSGISPNAMGLEGFTPLFFVFPAKTADVARALLQAGANPNARLADGTPPLLYAVRLENPAFTQVLLEFKADPNAMGPNGKPVIHEATRLASADHFQLLARAKANLDIVWGRGTPLYAAIGSLNFGAAAALLDLGADTQWRTPGEKVNETAGDRFCRLVSRTQPTATNRKPLQDLFAAFARRGVVLPCAGEAQRFK